MARARQIPLFDVEIDKTPNFPSTRYQGSKRKLIAWIRDSISGIEFDSVLDVFGGTGVVSFLFKSMDKEVTYNDSLAFNWNVGLALIENSNVLLTREDVETILKRHTDTEYPDFIGRTFQDIYFTDEENAWLDQTVFNINNLLHDKYKQALARFALFQSAIIKRPYNLFHRANLYMRNADVVRSFGNKVSWDTPFEVHFRAFAEEANQGVFDNLRSNKALNVDAFETPVGADLVYLDPPYLNSKGTGVDYRDFYHFLEGIVKYDTWPDIVDYGSKHKRLLPAPSVWHKADTILEAFDTVIGRHRHSNLVISYRDDGIPSQDQLVDVLKAYKHTVTCVGLPQQYALSKSKSHELLLIAT